jgi:hypothetical protein
MQQILTWGILGSLGLLLMLIGLIWMFFAIIEDKRRNERAKRRDSFLSRYEAQRYRAEHEQPYVNWDASVIDKERQ